MGLTSSIMKEQSINEFRKLNTSEQVTLKLPVPAEERQLTDRKGFLMFAILIFVLIPFSIYTLVNSDIRRIDHGYDSCGNLCGVKNEKIEEISCSGKDFIDKPFQTVNILSGERSCTSECPPGYVKDDNSCYGDDDDDEGKLAVDTEDLWAYYLKLWWKFITVILITTVLCIFTLVLFRFIPGAIVWSVLIISLIAAIGITVLFWIAYKNSKDDNDLKSGFLVLAIVSTIFTVITIIILVVVRKKIELVILLYKETSRALIAMPLLTIFPIITLLLQFLALTLLVINTTYMGTSGELTKVDSSGYYFYEKNNVFKFTIIFNIIVTLWTIVFFSGCQYMILAGSVAQWYFQKNNIKYPIVSSFTNTLRYHLGTIAFGSFIITLIAAIKAIIKCFISNGKIKWVVNCICGDIEALLKFLSKNAYIETAIYGSSFLRSGKRATRLLISNARSVIAINSVGDFVLAMTQFLLLVISTAISYAIFMNNSHTWLATIFSFIINLIIVVIVFSVFETIVDTMFVCFCEDEQLNDGSEAKPYYMTIGLKKFVDKSKEAYSKNKPN